MSRIGWREDEYRFGMVELARNRLHRIRLEALGLAHHRERIAGEAAVGEHVERGERPVHGGYLATSSVTLAPRSGVRGACCSLCSTISTPGCGRAAGFGRAAPPSLIRSSPRKRGPRAAVCGPWVPAYAGTNGVRGACCPASRGEGSRAARQSPLIRPASISKRLKRRASAPPAQ